MERAARSQHTPATFSAGDEVVVRVPGYGRTKPDRNVTMTVVRVTPTGKLRLSDGALYSIEKSYGVYGRWVPGVMNSLSWQEVIGLAE
jgi:hypothetical protein